AGTSGGDLHGGDVRAEHVQLIRGLVRTDPAVFVGSVSGDREQPEPAVAGLQERGVEVRRGRSRGGHHRGGPEPREAEGGEGGDAFVDAYVHLDPSPAFGAGERVGKRGAAGTGAEHDALHAVEDERVHEGSGGLGGRVGGAGHGWLRSSSTSRRTRVRRSFQRWVVPGSAAVRSRSGRREIAPAGRTGRDPPSGTRGRAAVSVVKRLIVASPQAKGSSGSAAASATPAAIPTEDSSAEETTAGRPTCSMISSAARTPPSGCTLTTMMSAASCRATSSVSLARRIDSSAATGTATARRTRARSATGRQGCSAYSNPPAARSRARRCAIAVSTSHPPLASTRILPPDPSASRTAATRSSSSSSDSPGSATLTFAVRHPPEACTSSAARTGPTAGIVTLTGTRSRRGAGHPR